MSTAPAGTTAEVPLMTKPWIEIERFYRGLVKGGLDLRLERFIDQLHWVVREKAALS
jgi:hypothetical protein